MGRSTSDRDTADAAALAALLAPVEIAGLEGLTLHLAKPGAAVGRLAGVTGGDAPYWAFAWPGGRALALFLQSEPHWVRGRTVVDYGCGCGIVALAAARAGAAHVLAVDRDPWARQATALNAGANGFDIDVSERLDPGMEVDVVLAGDVFYAPDVARNSLRLLRERVGRDAVVLVGDPGRRDLPSGLPVLATFTLADIGTRASSQVSVYRLGV
jgi:predicted nicotinamide N-methyase